MTDIVLYKNEEVVYHLYDPQWELYLTGKGIQLSVGESLEHRVREELSKLSLQLGTEISIVAFVGEVTIK